MRFNPLLLKLYLLLTLSAAAIGLTIDYYLQHYYQAEIQQNRELEHKSTFMLVEARLFGKSPDSWQGVIETLQTELSLGIELKTRQEVRLSPMMLQQLADGQTLALELEQGSALVKQRADPTQLVFLWFDREPPRAYWSLAFYPLLALPALLVLWPLNRDLTQMQRASQHIARQNFSTRVKLSPSSAIASIGHVFDQMAEQIEFLIREQKQLTNAVSHELRTPLARLKFALSLLLSRDANSREQATIAGMVQDVDELNGLVEEMLSYARLDNLNQPLDWQTIDAREWLQSIIDDCYIERNLVRLTSHCQLDLLQFDPHLMARAASNLLTNALKFARSQVTIALESANSCLVIRVSDDGPGIAPPDRTRIFEPFARIDDSRNRQSGGYGLGLAIVKRIVARHQGQVQVRTSSLGGAEFVVSWPISTTTDAPI